MRSIENQPSDQRLSGSSLETGVVRWDHRPGPEGTGDHWEENVTGGWYGLDDGSGGDLLSVGSEVVGTFGVPGGRVGPWILTGRDGTRGTIGSVTKLRDFVRLEDCGVYPNPDSLPRLLLRVSNPRRL